MSLRYIPLRSLAALLFGCVSSVLFIIALSTRSWLLYDLHGATMQSHVYQSLATLYWQDCTVSSGSSSGVGSVLRCTTTVTSFSDCSGTSSTSLACVGYGWYQAAFGSGVLAAMIGLAAPFTWATNRSFAHHYALLCATVSMVSYSVGYSKAVADGIGVSFADMWTRYGGNRPETLSHHAGFSFNCFGCGIAFAAIAFLFAISHSCLSTRGAMALCIATGMDSSRLRPQQRGRRYGWISLAKMPYEAHMLHLPGAAANENDEPVEMRVTASTDLPS